MERTSIVRLVVDKDAEERLKLLCSLSSKLWNEVNYARRRMFFEKRGVDLKATYKEFYEKYKTLIGSATAQQVLNKNDEAWRSFFKLLKLKKEGRLPPFITRVNPPGVQLLYRFVWFYGHRLISIPPHPARDLIELGGVRGHPGDPTSWVSLGAALRASQGSPLLCEWVFKAYKFF